MHQFWEVPTVVCLHCWFSSLVCRSG